MANITSKITLTSKIEELDDVKFVIYRMTEARRMELRKALAEVNGETQKLSKELATLDVKENAARIDEITSKIDELFTDVIDPAWIKWGLHSIENLKMDDEVITKEDINKAPSTLYREILTAIRKESGLGDDESKNSPLPTISGEPVTVTQ